MSRLAWTSAVLGAALVCIACDQGSHIYLGELFVEARGCLGGQTSLDTVDGDPPDHDCAPICLAQPEADGGRAIYVATMCAPYPFLFDASGSDYACPAALAALARGDTCFVDGGSQNPVEAGPPADAGHD
jgi:hypothetical protein